MRFVLATRNAHKLAEYRAILAPHQVEPMPDDVELPPEGAESFAANARAKAEALARAVSRGGGRSAAPPAAAPPDPAVVIADDSGIEVEALGGAPGVVSARYAGRDGDDAANNARLLAELAALRDAAARAARFVCVIAFCPGGAAEAQLVRGEWPGAIAETPHGRGGFGYDPVFVPEGRTTTVAEMSDADKNRESHRARAAHALLARLTAGQRR
jgi:XTP/dITP diphosphohydrolase